MNQRNGFSVLEMMVSLVITGIIVGLTYRLLLDSTLTRDLSSGARDARELVAQLGTDMRSRFLERVRVNDATGGVLLNAANPYTILFRQRIVKSGQPDVFQRVTYTTVCQSVGSSSPFAGLPLHSVPAEFCGSLTGPPACTGLYTIAMTNQPDETLPATTTVYYPPTMNITSVSQRGLPQNFAVAAAVCTSVTTPGTGIFLPISTDQIRVVIAVARLGVSNQVTWEKVGLVLPMNDSPIAGVELAGGQ